eukprot:3591730-Pleurochrysis_carterae.AAC.1
MLADGHIAHAHTRDFADAVYACAAGETGTQHTTRDHGRTRVTLCTRTCAQPHARLLDALAHTRARRARPYRDEDGLGEVCIAQMTKHYQFIILPC